MNLGMRETRMKASVFIATSLDGYIARDNGAIDWLSSADSEGEDYGYRAFFDTVDVLVMGRNTFDSVRTFSQWPYGTKPVVVLTTRSLELSAALADRVETLSGSPGAITQRLAMRGAKHLYIDGGKTIQAFLAEGLIQRLIITRIPILIGRGIPLFGPVPKDIRWHHVDTRTYPGGLVQSEYEIVQRDRAGGVTRDPGIQVDDRALGRDHLPRAMSQPRNGLFHRSLLSTTGECSTRMSRLGEWDE